jgi:hypothetical protein
MEVMFLIGPFGLYEQVQVSQEVSSAGFPIVEHVGFFVPGEPLEMR